MQITLSDNSKIFVDYYKSGQFSKIYKNSENFKNPRKYSGKVFIKTNDVMKLCLYEFNTYGSMHYSIPYIEELDTKDDNYDWYIMKQYQQGYLKKNLDNTQYGIYRVLQQYQRDIFVKAINTRKPYILLAIDELYNRHTRIHRALSWQLRNALLDYFNLAYSYTQSAILDINPSNVAYYKGKLILLDILTTGFKRPF